MQRNWLVYSDGKLWDRKLTKAGAEKVAKELEDKGLMNVWVAYEIVPERVEE